MRLFSTLSSHILKPSRDSTTSWGRLFQGISLEKKSLFSIGMNLPSAPCPFHVKGDPPSSLYPSFKDWKMPRRFHLSLLSSHGIMEWNPRMVWVGKDLKDHPIPTPATGRDIFPYPRVLQRGLGRFQGSKGSHSSSGFPGRRDLNPSAFLPWTISFSSSLMWL